MYKSNLISVIFNHIREVIMWLMGVVMFRLAVSLDDGLGGKVDDVHQASRWAFSVNNVITCVVIIWHTECDAVLGEMAFQLLQ
jgi:hypothetical protein